MAFSSAHATAGWGAEWFDCRADLVDLPDQAMDAAARPPGHHFRFRSAATPGAGGRLCPRGGRDSMMSFAATTLQGLANVDKQA